MATPRHSHFHGLDLLRGLAAMSVIVWHWQHFLVPGVLDAPRDAQPLYETLRPLYLHGTLAVDLFFCLSGFVFFNVYLQSIHARKTDLRSFWINRFARLFPLHWLMLGLTVLLQWIYHHQHGKNFHSHNDGLLEFVLQAAMLHYWVPGAQVSWNIPTWSLSIELMVYALFFVFARRVNSRTWLAALLIAVISLVLVKSWNASIGRGVSSFFMGGLAWLAVHWLHGPGRPHRSHAALASCVLAMACWTIGLATVYEAGWLLPWLKMLPVKLRTGFPFYALFPSTVLAVALCEGAVARWIKPLALIGNVSYSVYLIHFPLQILVFLLVRAFQLDPTVLLSPLSLATFIVLTLAFGQVSYRYFEQPCQRWIRQRFETASVRQRGSKLPQT